MSILHEGLRGRVAGDLLKNKEEMVRIANNIINDIIVRRARLEQIREIMQENPDVFTASDLADVDAVEGILFQKVQQVYDIFTSS
jgi:hypothetical protein